MTPFSEPYETPHFRRALPVRCDRSEGCGPASLTRKPNHPLGSRSATVLLLNSRRVFFFSYDRPSSRSQMLTEAFRPLTRLPVRPRLSEGTQGAVVRVCYRITISFFFTPSFVSVRCRKFDNLFHRLFTLILCFAQSELSLPVYFQNIFLISYLCTERCLPFDITK